MWNGWIIPFGITFPDLWCDRIIKYVLLYYGIYLPTIDIWMNILVVLADSSFVYIMFIIHWYNIIGRRILYYNYNVELYKMHIAIKLQFIQHSSIKMISKYVQYCCTEFCITYIWNLSFYREKTEDMHITTSTNISNIYYIMYNVYLLVHALFDSKLDRHIHQLYNLLLYDVFNNLICR